MSRRMPIIILIAFALAIIGFYSAYSRSTTASSAAASPKSGNQYAVLAWNDLGMHCYDPSFENLAILPPYNTIWAQVIKIGNPPTIVTEGITVYYSIPGNTYSADKPPFQAKSDFWTYCPGTFNVTLPKHIGLTGKGLSGKMDLVNDHFEAKGIPLTEYLDKNALNPNPSKWNASHFQLALVVVVDTKTGTKLAQTNPTAPVSTELNCAMCHSDDGDATTRYPIQPTGNVDTNILAIHDYLNPTVQPPLSQQTPVLCADCHSDNALGLSGEANVKSLSNAMHGRHFSPSIPDITPDTDGCYNCHPGPTTQCLRDTMSQNYGFSCVDCHGNMGMVAENTNPWLNEPRCDDPNCHGAGYTLNDPLYRFSTGHGGLYCEACHGSTHAISPSREPNDDVRFIALQGTLGPLKKCTVCHSPAPETAFKHRPGAVYSNETSPVPTTLSFSQNTLPLISLNIKPGASLISALALTAGFVVVAAVGKRRPTRKT